MTNVTEMHNTLTEWLYVMESKGRDGTTPVARALMETVRLALTSQSVEAYEDAREAVDEYAELFAGKMSSRADSYPGGHCAHTLMALDDMEQACKRLLEAIPLERGGRRDGDGYWHGSDVMGALTHEVEAACQKYMRVTQELAGSDGRPDSPFPF